MTEETSQETEAKSEETEFAKVIEKTVRGPKQGIYEHLLCQTLVAAVGSEPLKKIRLTCEAAMMVEDLQAIGIDKNEVDLIYNVAVGFKNTSHYQFKGHFYCYMAWSFQSSEENYGKYIKAWRQPYDLCFYRITPGYYSQDYYDERARKVNEALSEYPEWKRFFTITKSVNLTNISFNVLLSQFINFALPKTQLMFSKLARLVNPNLYQEILKTYAETQKPQKTESTRGLEL